MPIFEKLYDVEGTVTCAVNCPFMTITTKDSEAGENVQAHCERYKRNLFKTPDDEKFLRVKNCTLIQVKWIFEFGDSNASKN